MNRIFGIFVTFLLIPSLPTFGAMDEYEKCELNAGMKAFREWGFSEIPAEYQDKIDKIINSPVEQESSGTCTPGGNYHCNKGDIFKDCCPCAQFDAEMQVEEIFRQDYIKKECGHIKKQNLQETQATNNHPDNNFDFAATSATQNASSGLLLATPAQEDEPQQKASAMSADISGTIDTNDALLLGMTHLDVTPCTLRDGMSLTYQNFKKQITCPIGTKSMTITFTTKASDYKIENPKHVISLSPEKQKYTLPETIKISVKPEKNSTASMAKVCKNSVGKLNCADLTITCTNGFNNGWNEQKALDAMCPTEVQSEQTRREKLKKDAESRFCKSGMKFEADCKANKVIFGCDEYSRRTPNEIERKLQNYCSATKTNTVEIQDETTQKRADKKENEEKLKKTCEELGTKGKWNKTLKQCNCNEKNHIFDEETGCSAATPKFIEAQKEIEKLKSQLEATITELNKQQ